MDTIIYIILTKKNDITQPVTVKATGSHRLLCVRISDKLMPQEPVVVKTQAIPEKEKKEKGGVFAALRRRRERRREQKRQLSRQQWMKDVAEDLMGKLVPYLTVQDACYTMYDGTMVKWLNLEDRLYLWNHCWPFEEFHGYHELACADEMLAGEYPPHFLILGYNRYLPELIMKHIRRIRSLRLVLDCQPEEFIDFLDDLYEEYGLTVSIHMLSEEEGEMLPFRKYRIICPLTSTIIDYTGEPHLNISQVAEKSIWLDMDSLEEKRRRLEGRNTGIRYLSFKKHVKTLSDLDITDKNGYNTGVNQE